MEVKENVLVTVRLYFLKFISVILQNVNQQITWIITILKYDVELKSKVSVTANIRKYIDRIL